MTRRNRPRRDSFPHPTPDEVDLDQMLAAMRDCHAAVLAFWQRCGLRNPAQEQARTLLAHLCALAALTRVPGAERYVNPLAELHSTPGRDRQP